MENTTSPNLIHQELLTELNWTAENLPQEIQTKIATLDTMVVEYSTAPTPDLFKKIELLSGKLWHLIKDEEEKAREEYVETLPENTGTPAAENNTPASRRKLGGIFGSGRK